LSTAFRVRYIHHVIVRTRLRNKYFVNLVQNTIARKNIDFDNSAVNPTGFTTPSPSFPKVINCCPEVSSAAVKFTHGDVVRQTLTNSAILAGLVKVNRRLRSAAKAAFVGARSVKVPGIERSFAAAKEYKRFRSFRVDTVS
jgi:hypothetical protein